MFAPHFPPAIGSQEFRSEGRSRNRPFRGPHHRHDDGLSLDPSLKPVELPVAHVLNLILRQVESDAWLDVPGSRSHLGKFAWCAVLPRVLDLKLQKIVLARIQPAWR
jgi:hypothetical protein